MGAEDPTVGSLLGSVSRQVLALLVILGCVAGLVVGLRLVGQWWHKDSLALRAMRPGDCARVDHLASAPGQFAKDGYHLVYDGLDGIVPVGCDNPDALLKVVSTSSTNSPSCLNYGVSYVREYLKAKNGKGYFSLCFAPNFQQGKCYDADLWFAERSGPWRSANCADPRARLHVTARQDKLTRAERDTFAQALSCPDGQTPITVGSWWPSWSEAVGYCVIGGPGSIPGGASEVVWGFAQGECARVDALADDNKRRELRAKHGYRALALSGTSLVRASCADPDALLATAVAEPPEDGYPPSGGTACFTNSFRYQWEGPYPGKHFDRCFVPNLRAGACYDLDFNYQDHSGPWRSADCADPRATTRVLNRFDSKTDEKLCGLDKTPLVVRATNPAATDAKPLEATYCLAR